jgi:hypothetical protein
VVACALYSLPTRWIGVRLRARATVRFYHRGVLVKTHPRCPPGGRSTHAEDFPAGRTASALREVTHLQTQADAHGEAVRQFVRTLLDAAERFGAAWSCSRLCARSKARLTFWRV